MSKVYVQSVDWVQELVVPISIDDEVIHRKKFKLLASVNQSGNLNRSHYTAHTKINSEKVASL